MNKRCLSCPRVGPWGRSGRCDEHRREVERRREADPARRAKKAALYTHEHRERRKAWEPLVRAGRVKCWRCLQPIDPEAEWDLGHKDGRPFGPEHPLCNRGKHDPVEHPLPTMKG